MSNEERLRQAHIEQRELLARLGAEHKALNDEERSALIERLTILRRMILALKTAERHDPSCRRSLQSAE